jgi:hypothetical protein
MSQRPPIDGDEDLEPPHPFKPCLSDR